MDAGDARERMLRFGSFPVAFPSSVDVCFRSKVLGALHVGSGEVEAPSRDLGLRHEARQRHLRIGPRRHDVVDVRAVAVTLGARRQERQATKAQERWVTSESGRRRHAVPGSRRIARGSARSRLRPSRASSWSSVSEAAQSPRRDEVVPGWRESTCLGIFPSARRPERVAVFPLRLELRIDGRMSTSR